MAFIFYQETAGTKNISTIKIMFYYSYKSVKDCLSASNISRFQRMSRQSGYPLAHPERCW